MRAYIPSAKCEGVPSAKYGDVYIDISKLEGEVHMDDLVVKDRFYCEANVNFNIISSLKYTYIRCAVLIFVSFLALAAPKMFPWICYNETSLY